MQKNVFNQFNWLNIYRDKSDNDVVWRRILKKYWLQDRQTIWGTKLKMCFSVYKENKSMKCERKIKCSIS